MKPLQQILDEKATAEGWINWNQLSRSNLANQRDKIFTSAALEYAEGEAKAFAEFIVKHGFKKYAGSVSAKYDREVKFDKWYQPHFSIQNFFTTTELYNSEEFKKFKETL